MDILTVTCLVLAGVIVGWLVHEARDMIEEMQEDRMEGESWH
jgi:hypothetical protein